MKESYGELMSLLVRHRYRFASEEEFQAYIRQSIRDLASDLSDMGMEIRITADLYTPRRSSRDWNYLKIGCE